MKRLIFLAVLYSMFLFAACTLPSKEVGTPLDWGLLGRWRELGGTKTLQFFGGGTLITKQGSKSTSSFYRIVDERSIEIDPKYAPHTKLNKSASRVVQATIHGNELTLIESGKSLKFIKVD